MSVCVPKGVVLTAGATRLTTKVPPGAESGKISVTSVDLTVVSTGDFTVTAPTITSFNPAGGEPGSTVGIAGRNFSLPASENTVKFDGLAATVVSGSSTALVVTVPAGTLPGPITVQTPGGTATSATDFRRSPVVTGFSPASAPVGGQITVNGQYFSTTASENTAKIGGRAAGVVSATATALTVQARASGLRR